MSGEGQIELLKLTIRKQSSLKMAERFAQTPRC